MSKTWIRFGIGLVCTTLTALVIAAQPPEKKATQFDEGSQTEQAPQIPKLTEEDRQRASEAAIVKQLQKSIQLKFKNAPLSDVIKLFADSSEVNFVIDQRSLDDEGIGSDEPVTITLEETTIETALHHVLKPLELDWIMQDEVVKITTASAAHDVEQHSVTRTYSVGWVDSTVESKTTAPKLKDLVLPCLGSQPNQQGGPGFNAGGMSGQDRVLEFIENHTSGPWLNIEGEGGELALFNDTLVVKHVPKVQREVDTFLAAMKQALTTKLPDHSMPVLAKTYPRAADEKIRAALSKKISAEFADVALTDATQFLSNSAGIDIQFDRQSLRDEGIGLNEIVNLAVKDVTLKSALQLLLQPLELATVIDRGTLKITTATIIAEAETHLECRIYQVGDVARGDISGLSMLIAETIPGPWIDIEGMGGWSTEGPGETLIITHLPETQQKIVDLIASLRKRKQENPPMKSATEKTKPTPDGLVIYYYTFCSEETATGMEKAIPMFVARNSWAARGDGLIQRIGMTLVVKQTPQHHRELQTWLLEFFERTSRGSSDPFSTNFFSNPVKGGKMPTPVPSGSGQGFFTTP